MLRLRRRAPERPARSGCAERTGTPTEVGRDDSTDGFNPRRGRLPSEQEAQTQPIVPGASSGGKEPISLKLLESLASCSDQGLGPGLHDLAALSVRLGSLCSPAYAHASVCSRRGSAAIRLPAQDQWLSSLPRRLAQPLAEFRASASPIRCGSSAGASVAAQWGITRHASIRVSPSADGCPGRCPPCHAPRAGSGSDQGTRAQQGRHGLDAVFRGAGAADDHTGPCPVLRRAGARQERGLHAHAGVRDRLPGGDPVGALRLQPGVYQRRRRERLRRRPFQGSS